MNPSNLKAGFDKMLQADTIIRRQNLTLKNKKKTYFCSIVRKYEELLGKSMIIQSQFGLDMSSYENPFFNLIDDIFLFSWGDDVYQLIQFYLYEKIDLQTGDEQFLTGPGGEEIYLRTPEDLFMFIEKNFPETL